MEFRQRLQTLRRRQGFTQYRLAQVSGVPRQVIGRLESGQRQLVNLSVGVAMRLARALHVSMDFLVGMTKDAEQEDAGLVRSGRRHQTGRSRCRCTPVKENYDIPLLALPYLFGHNTPQC